MNTLFFTLFALTAFAANSVFCRLALVETNLNPLHFTWIRLLSGIFVLQGIRWVHQRREPEQNRFLAAGSKISFLMLFIYALTFSLAYITLDTGTGALILFGAVQITMILASLFEGERLRLQEWFGLLIAFGGFVYLVLPGVGAPPLEGLFFMSLSGVAWGIYTLRGRGSQFPLQETASNFLRTWPLILCLIAITCLQRTWNLSFTGVIWAVLSGGLASGVGYSLWYAALRNLSSLQSAVLQLLVPVIAAVGGGLFLQEAITWRLILASLCILGGVLLVILKRKTSA